MKGGRTHWILLRALSLPLVPLSVYFLTQIEFIVTRSRMEFLAWAGQPLTALALALFAVCAFGHASMGMDEIIIDYVPGRHTQKLSLIACRLLFAALGLVSLYALYTIRFGQF